MKQILRKECVELFKWNDVHLIVKVSVVCIGDNEQFLVIAGQLAVRCFAEIAGVRLFPVYQQHSRADLAAVLQDRHIQERQRGGHIPAAVGIQAAGMVASRSLIVGIIVLYKLRCVLRQRINYATRQRIAAVFVIYSALCIHGFFLLKACLLRILSIKISVGRYTGHVVHGHSSGNFDAGVNGGGIERHAAPATDTDDTDALRVIECLKKAGMEIKDIRQFMDWCVEGPSTYPQRKTLFEEQRSHMETELEQMNRTLDMLKFKCWYYEQAIKDGSEDRLKTLIPDRLPDGIRKAYENAHS